MLPTLPAVLITVVSVLICVACYARRWRPRGYPPGPPPLPFIGNFHHLGIRPWEKFMEMQRKYGPIIAIDFASFRGVVINDFHLIREALSMREFSGRPRLKVFMDRTQGAFRGLILSQGTPWSEHRRFTLKKLREFGMGSKSMETIIQDEIDKLMSTLFKLDGKPSDVAYIFNLTALNNLWWIMTGERFTHDDKRVQGIMKLMIDAIGDSPTASAIFFFPWIATVAPRLSGFQNILDVQLDILKLANDIYDKQRATFKSGQPRHFLDLYIQQVIDTKDTSSTFYGQEGELNLICSIADLFIAGVETLSTTMAWSILLLSLHPNAQDRMYEEMKSVTGLRRVATMSDEPSMPYMKAVIAEVLRYSSIVPLNVFHSSIEDVDFHGYRIPKDTMILLNLYAAHHDPAVWGDPEAFRPERFLTEDGQFSKAKEQATIPFSFGRRICIGESLARDSLFLMHANIFQRFKVLPDPAKPAPKIDYTPSFVLHPKPYEYIFEHRP